MKWIYMKKITLLIVLFCFLSQVSPSQVQSKKYFVAFCSKESSSSSTAGHAFVAIGYGDPFTCSVDGKTEAWGLYAADAGKKNTSCKPSSIQAGKSIFVGKVPGCLFSDVRTNMDNVFVIPCTFDEYLQAYGVIHQWRQKKYELKEQDCLTFLIAVANVFKNRIKIPSRSGLNNLPNKYVQRLKGDNTK